MDATPLLALNAHHDVVNFKLPEVAGAKVWRRLIDTNAPEAEGAQRVRIGDEDQITGRRPPFVVELEHAASVASSGPGRFAACGRRARRGAEAAPEAAPAEAPEPAHAGE